MTANLARSDRQLAAARDLVQVRNPRSCRFVLIDKGAGMIISTKKSAGPYAKVRIVTAAKKAEADT